MRRTTGMMGGMGERRYWVVGEWMVRGLAAGLLLLGAYLKYEALLSPVVGEGRG